MKDPDDSLKRRDSIHVGSIFKMEFTPSEEIIYKKFPKI